MNFVVIYFLALIAGALVGAFYPTPRPYANTHEAVTDNIRALDTLYETHTERFVFLGIVSTLLTILAFFTSYAWAIFLMLIVCGTASYAAYSGVIAQRAKLAIDETEIPELVQVPEPHLTFKDTEPNIDAKIDDILASAKRNR